MTLLFILISMPYKPEKCFARLCSNSLHGYALLCEIFVMLSNIMRQRPPAEIAGALLAATLTS
jgi:hypothetical protein